MSRARGSVLPAAAAALAAATVALLLGACDLASGARSTGERVWLKNCAECHGVNGAGKIPKYRRYEYADLLDDFWRNGGDDDSITSSITEGVSLIMPAFDQLSDEELHAVVDYIRELRAGR